MRGHWRWAILGTVLAGLAAGALLALAAARYYPAYRSALAARDDLRGAQELLRERGLDASAADLVAAEERLDKAERGFRRARQTFGDPLLRLGWRAPLLGGSLEATVGLADIGLEGVYLGRDAVALARTFQRLRDEGTGPLTERTEEILAEMDPPMSAVEERLERLREKRDRVTGATLPLALVGAVQELDRDLEEMRELTNTYDDLSTFLPAFLGFEGPRTYLVLAQNNAELLPTGGLISVYGILTVEEGRVTERYFEDAVGYGGRWLEQSHAYIEPPAPLRRYLLRDVSWNFAVANWSPHFPTAAQDAERLFRLAGGRPVDGVIAINVDTIEELLSVTGPITVESYGVTVSAENALDVIEEHTRTAQEMERDRKAFVGVLAEELLSRLTRLPPDRWTALLEALQRLRDRRQVLLFSHDPEMQRLAYRLGIDGALKNPKGDYLMLVDASVNSTKLNIVLEQRVDLTVRIDAWGAARHQVAVSYHNNLPAWSQGRDPLLVRRLMLGGVYGGYLRLLAPWGSEIGSVTLAGQEVGPEEIGSEQGKAAFGRYFALAGGQETTLGFAYTTPAIVRSAGGLLEYRLLLQKQPGTGAVPVALRLALPEGARLRSAELDGSPVDSLAGVETDLAEDRELVVRYQLDR